MGTPANTFAGWLKRKGELWSSAPVDEMRRRWAFLLNKGLKPAEVESVFDTIWDGASAQYGE